MMVIELQIKLEDLYSNLFSFAPGTNLTRTHCIKKKTRHCSFVLFSPLAARIAFPKLASLILSPPRKLMLGIPKKIVRIEK